MRRIEEWRPSKYVATAGGIRGTRNVTDLGLASRLSADRIAACYEKYCKEHCRGHLVDLGCGQVPLFLVYSKYVSSITCVDWGNSIHGNIHVDAICDLASPLPFEDEAFDTVILSDVLEHLPSPEAIWSEIRRITRVGGKVLLNVPFFYWLHERPHDYYRFTDTALRRFAASHKFEVLVLETTGGSLEVVADIAAKHLQHLPILGAPLAMAVQSITGWFTSAFTTGRNISRNTSQVFPYGYFMVAVRCQ